MISRTISLLLIALIAAAVLANQDANPVAPTAPTAVVAEEALLPAPVRGVHVQFKSGDQRDSRIDRLVALHVPEGQPVSPMLPAGAFTATYTGNINVGLRGRYTFSIEGQGSVKVTLGDTVILEGTGDLSKIEPAQRLRLNKGENPFTIEYIAPDQGAASFRLYWECDEFPREPVHPSALTTGLPLRSDIALMHQGRELFATHRCVKCHAPDEALAKSPALMPELKKDAPDLSSAGTRLKVDWIAAWISNPRSLRADATMPRVHTMGGGAGGGRGQEGMVSMWAADIAAYLGTLGKPTDIAAFKPEAVKEGGHLFASLGCIGCHTRPDHHDAKTVDDRVPLKYVTAKWQPAALRAFLLKPSAHYTWIRMPDFALSEADADALSAFLLSHDIAPLPSRQGRGRAPSPEHGKQMFQMHGCVACHDHGAKEQGWVNHLNATPLTPLSEVDWNKGCMSDDLKSIGNAPDFGFTAPQRQALRAFAATAMGWRSLSHDTAADFARRQIHQLQCTACHKRDGDNDRWSNHENEVASLLIKPHVEEKPKVDDFDDAPPGGEQKGPQIDQSRPELTWVGDKLRPQWMEQFFAGKLDYKLRPWLTARMPAFPARAQGLAQGLALQHGLPPVPAEQPKPDAALATLGKQLVGRSIDSKAGFACVQCHGVGDRPAENVFEAQGINFAYSKERLNHDFYMRWMLKPGRVQPGTRMPQFAADDGTTPFTDALGGDARKQFDAIWQYLLTGRELKAP